MSRITDSANAAELTQPSIIGCVMCDMDFFSGHVYVCDGMSEVTFAGNTYSPLGQFAGIEVVNEGLDAIARPLKLTLSGVDSSIVGLAQNDPYQNREVTIYVGLLNRFTGVFVANPMVAWEGRMDYMEIAIDAGMGKITLNCEHRLRREPRIARYTDVDQQQLHPGDKFMNFVTTIAGFKSQWGDQHMTYGGPTGVSRFKYPWTYFPGGHH